MKVHPFEVARNDGSIELEDVLHMIEHDVLVERVRMVGKVEVRAETVARKGSIWLLDFVKFRYDHAPGKAHRERPIEGFPFDEGEGAGEETAMLYDASRRTAIVQYNHYGVRSGSICDYLSSYSRTPGDGFTFKPKYDRDAERRLLSKKLFRRIDFAIAATKMKPGDRASGQSVSRALDLGRAIDAGMISVSLSVGIGNRGSLNMNAVREMAEQVRGLFRRNAEAVSRLEVAGKSNADDTIEVLDLLEPRLALEVPTEKPGGDLRVPRDARWRALEIAHAHWKKQG